MLEQGPEIARRADRVGALPLAPLAFVAPKNLSPGAEFIPPLGTLWTGLNEMVSVPVPLKKVKLVSTIKHVPLPHNFPLPEFHLLGSTQVVRAQSLHFWHP